MDTEKTPQQIDGEKILRMFADGTCEIEFGKAPKGVGGNNLTILTGGSRERDFMRAAIYSRVSTASKSRHGDAVAHDQSPQVQEDILRRVAEYRDWQVEAVYSDRGSGAEESQPGLDALIRDARRRRFDVLLVFRFDRLSRSVRHFLQVVEELRGAGVGLYSHEQSLDTTTAMGQFCLTMFAALAELERSCLYSFSTILWKTL